MAKPKNAPQRQPRRVAPGAPASGATLSPQLAQQITRLVDQRIGHVLRAVAQHAVPQRAGARPQTGGGQNVPVDPREVLAARLRGGR